MKKVKSSIVALLLIVTGIKAQETTSSEEFIPSGKPSVKIFTNAHSTFIDGSNTSAFEVQRAYFGYSYNFSKNFSTKVTFDVGDPGVGKLQMTAYLKNAALTYKKDKFTLDQYKLRVKKQSICKEIEDMFAPNIILDDNSNDNGIEIILE